MDRTVCKIDACSGCGACVDSCSRKAIKIVDSFKSFNAIIDDKICIECGACERVCPNVVLVEKKPLIFARQGWAIDDGVRSRSSSGGIATALSLSFIKDGGVVCSCAFDSGKFNFAFADTVEAVSNFAGSKYVKSAPSRVYLQIKDYVKQHRKVLFIGLPCQVAAVKKIVGNNQYLYTVDLICHGTPSANLLSLYLNECGHSINKLEDISFRSNNEFFLSANSKRITPKSVYDKYTYAFLNGLTYTENCYCCPYATLHRVSDITLGDSWGSTLPNDEVDKGVSLVLCMSEKGEELLSKADVKLLNVDLDIAVSNNKQLRNPTVRPPQRERFFDDILRGKTFNSSVSKCFSYYYFKQSIKVLLMKIKLYHK